MQPMPPINTEFSRKVDCCGLEPSHCTQRLGLIFSEMFSKEFHPFLNNILTTGNKKIGSIVWLMSHLGHRVKLKVLV
jgi:hypothetical protein